MASRKAWPEFRNVSLKRQISTPCWLRKCSSSSFLLRTTSAFQQARRRSLPRTVLLGRAAIYGHEENNGLQDSPRADCPCGEEGDGREEPTGQYHTCLEGEAIEEIRNILECGGGALGGDHHVGGCGFSGHGFYTRSCFLFRLPSNRFSCCCGFRLMLLRPGRLPGGGHFRLPGHLRDRLRNGFWIGVWRWSGGLDNTPPRTKWFHPSPRSVCSAEGPVC